ncbi:MAG: hypothetical protein WCF93_00295 [Candidatus Moraniibacteriota bacterium]
MYSPDNLQKINIPGTPEKKESEKIVYVQKDILPEEQEYLDPNEQYLHSKIEVAAGLIVLETKDDGRARVSYGLGSQSRETWKELWVPADKLAL